MIVKKTTLYDGLKRCVYRLCKTNNSPPCRATQTIPRLNFINRAPINLCACDKLSSSCFARLTIHSLSLNNSTFE